MRLSQAVVAFVVVLSGAPALRSARDEVKDLHQSVVLSAAKDLHFPLSSWPQRPC